MSFPRYPKYKSSGVEWLGEVPEGWEVGKVRQLFRAGKGKNGQMLTKEFCGANEGDYPVYSGQTENEGVMGTWNQFEFDFGETGVLFSTTVGAKAMNLRHLFGRFSLSQNCMIIWPTSSRCVTRFFYYHFQPLFQWQRSMIPDHMQPSFRMEDLYSCAIATPPLPEQTAIAEFLDRETGKIDELVAEQRRLMELLKEKRQAVISHAVTKGLNPHAPMKPSGIEWLGDVPEHWAVKRLKHVLARNGLVRGPFGGDLKKEIFQASGIKVYEQKNAIYRDYQLGESYVSAGKYSEMLRFRVTPGDYIMSCSGTIGKTYRLPESAPDGIINQALLIIRFSNNVTFQYADWIFDSEFFVKQILDNSQGGAMKNLVGMDVFTSISLPVPPLNEQLQIAQYLDAESSKFDTLTAEAQRAIDLLQERRTALISAAVTGQIDVRGFDFSTIND